jgi:putative ABC transport system permease protein
VIRSYLIIAWRNLVKNKLFSSINIIGLAIGIASCILIFLYVQNELSFDKGNANADRIYRLAVQIQPENRLLASSSPPMAPLLQGSFPEIEKAVRLNFENKATLSYKGNHFYNNQIMVADPDLWNVFSYEAIEGDLHSSLRSPNSIVLTQTSAKKYFGRENGMGKTMRFAKTVDLKVTCIIKDPPPNAHFNFECIIPHDAYGVYLGEGLNFGGHMTALQKDSMYKHYYENNIIGAIYSVYSYILVKKNTNAKRLERKLSVYMEQHLQRHKRFAGMWYNLKLQALTDIHLRSDLENEIRPNNDLKYIYIFSATAFLILLIACFNFINLSTARSLKRSKEIGMRKVIGAARSQLIAQFLGESLLFAILGGFLSLAIVLVCLPYFTAFTGNQYTLNLGLILAYLAVFICIGLLSGFYPAILMSSFQPIKALKGIIKHEWSDTLLRKGLVVFQFTIAVTLIISSVIVLKQMSFIQDRNIGLKKEQLIQIPLRKQEALVNELSKNPNVQSLSLNNFSIKSIPQLMMWPEGQGADQQRERNNICVDEHFFKTYQIDLLNGRDFSKEIKTDEDEGFIVNEAAARSFGWKNEEAIGKKIYWYKLTSEPEVGKIIGVVKDFNYASLHNAVEPLVIQIWRQRNSHVSLRLNTKNISSTMDQLELAWKKCNPEIPFSYSFLDEEFENLYKADRKLQVLISIFTFLSVLVACLGLFGMAIFAIEQRTKEIGIRKILGASVLKVVRLLSEDFLKLIVISIVIASPIAWYFSNKWLQDFAYRTEINWVIFLLVGILAVAIAFATIAFQTFKVAVANPIKSLRTE